MLRCVPNSGVADDNADRAGGDGALTKLTDTEIAGFVTMLGSAGAETVLKVPSGQPTQPSGASCGYERAAMSSMSAASDEGAYACVLGGDD
jgi:hypothetical protein